jgi:DNA invertase Pin-like site-specific DNA recombinase
MTMAKISAVTVADIWIRASSDKQDEQNQIAGITAYIAAKGYQTGRTWVAHDMSASKREHLPLLREAIAAMASGRSDVLVIRHTDRIDRTEDLGAILKEVAETGGRIESVNEPWVAELSGLGGAVMTTVTSFMNAEYVKKLSDNIRDGQARRRAAGSFTHGTRPYGYEIVGHHADGTRHPTPGRCPKCDGVRGGRKTLEPDDLAPVIVKIFERAASGKSYTTIARELQADGVPTQRGGPWGEGVIGQVIRNVAYRGQLHRRGVVYMTVEPLVSAVLWKAANDAVTSRSKIVGRGGGRKPRSPLRPVCGRCGGPMYIYNKEPRYARYTCAGLGPAGNSIQRKGCGNTIAGPPLDAEILAVFEQADDAEIVETVISGSDYAEEITQIQLEVKDLDMMADDYDEKYATLITELRRLRALPSQPARVEAHPTGRTEGEAFAAMTPDERIAFVRLWAITIMPKDDVPDGEPRWRLTRTSGSGTDLDAQTVRNLAALRQSAKTPQDTR